MKKKREERQKARDEQRAGRSKREEEAKAKEEEAEAKAEAARQTAVRERTAAEKAIESAAAAEAEAEKAASESAKADETAAEKAEASEAAAAAAAAANAAAAAAAADLEQADHGPGQFPFADLVSAAQDDEIRGLSLFQLQLFDDGGTRDVAVVADFVAQCVAIEPLALLYVADDEGHAQQYRIGCSVARCGNIGRRAGRQGQQYGQQQFGQRLIHGGFPVERAMLRRRPQRQAGAGRGSEARRAEFRQADLPARRCMAV